MCNIKLLPHNEVAYRKVKEQFESSNKACVVHATGTGKSFIIAATAEDYDKVLVLAPNNYVLSELGKTVGSNCTLMTYQSLSQIEGMENMNFDLIVLDEFHRTGAEVWGANVTKLLSANPNAKVLGTTATEIHTEGRNMADEMFDGNVVSRLTLPMAWSQGILKVPVYITGLYTFDNVDKEMRDKINKSNKTDDEKAKSLAELDNIRLDWIKGQGTDLVIKKHINPNSKRIIVFYDKIKNVTVMKNNVKSWVENAGLKVYKIYSVNSKNANSEKHMKDFEDDNFTGVKVMMAVNMLNEGVHVPKVDSLIMLRPTGSNIIYKQQMGRCMSISNESSPVIFDLVDNISNTNNYLTKLKDELKQLETERLSVKGKNISGPKDPVTFNVIDYMYDTRNLIEKLSNEYSYNTFDENFNELKEFVKKTNRLPQSRGYGKYESRLRAFIKSYKSDPKITEIVDQYGSKVVFKSFEENLNELKEFVRIYNRLPQSKKGEPRLSSFIRCYRTNPEIIDIVNQYSRKSSFEDNLSKLKEFIRIHNRLPKSKEIYEERLRGFIKLHKSNPEVMEIVEEYRRK